MLKCVLSLNEQTIKLMVYVSSILADLTNKNNMTIEDKLCLTQELIDLFLAGKINEETFNETILKLG